MRAHVARLGPAIGKPYADWPHEAYYVIHLGEVLSPAAPPLTGSELTTRFGREISQVVRGETQELSEVGQKEVLTSSLSYYPDDILVVGWLAALVYDTPEGATGS